MVHALLAEWEATGVSEQATWISLASSPTPPIQLSARTVIEHVALSGLEQSEYAKAKGEFWNALHGLAEDVDFAAIDQGLTHLARTMAAKATEAHRRTPFDAFYVHDFQVMRIARYLPANVPTAFRWHGPAHPMDPRVEAYLASCLNEFGSVIVHTKRYAQELRRMGVTVPIHASYPYVPDPPARAITHTELDAFDARFGIARDDTVFTLVARLDPIKSQDVAIRALSRAVESCPDARLLVVGGGGFSAGRGGLGMGHAVEWRDELAQLAKDLGVAERVTFTGGILDDELEVAFARSRAIVLPSRVEGFGLAPLEGWHRSVPVIVSRGAGIAELVRDGQNGFAFPPDDIDSLARAMVALASNESEAKRMGREGQTTATECTVGRAARDEWRVLVRSVRASRSILVHGPETIMTGMRTLITDLDRTLTGPDLKLDEHARRMLRELRGAGIRVILATGRPLVHVVQLGLRELTDALVVENGAIVMDSRTRETHITGGGFRAQAERALGDIAPHFSWSRIVGSGPRELAAEAEARLLKAGMQCNLEFNEEHVMLLPAGVDKSTGALTALRLLGVRSRDVWAIGDGENDVPLFRIARESAAPAQATAAISAQTTITLVGEYAEGFVEFGKRLLRDSRIIVEHSHAAGVRPARLDGS
ncbi:MAG: glycosyltransferase [Candidatus Thermoplasmatota archaeon]